MLHKSHAGAAPPNSEASGTTHERRHATTKRCCVPTRAQSRRRRSMGHAKTWCAPRQRGPVARAGALLLPPMRAWLEQPHGRRHKAPPQPCVLTTTRTGPTRTQKPPSRPARCTDDESSSFRGTNPSCGRGRRKRGGGAQKKTIIIIIISSSSRRRGKHKRGKQFLLHVVLTTCSTTLRPDRKAMEAQQQVGSVQQTGGLNP